MTARVDRWPVCYEDPLQHNDAHEVECDEA